MTFLKKKGGFLAGLLVMLTLFTACNDDNDVPQPDYDVAGFMAFNLVPDQEGIGVALSGNTVNIMPFMRYTGGYVKAYPGERSTDAFAANSQNTLTSTTFNYEANKYYSLFVMGLEGNYKNVIVNDGLDTMDATDGKSYLRFVNGIADGSAVNVELSNDTATLFSEQADYSKVSPFMELDSGAITIDINDGSDIQVNRTIQLENQKAYTILLAGNPQSTEPEDSVQIRYIINGTLTLDSTSSDLTDETN